MNNHPNAMKQIVTIYRDDSLSPKEKIEKINDLVKNADSYEENVEQYGEERAEYLEKLKKFGASQ